MISSKDLKGKIKKRLLGGDDGKNIVRVSLPSLLIRLPLHPYTKMNIGLDRTTFLPLLVQTLFDFLHLARDWPMRKRPCDERRDRDSREVQ